MIEFAVRVNDGRYEVDDSYWGTIGIEDPDAFRCALNYIEMLMVGVTPDVAFRRAREGLGAYIRKTKADGDGG